MVTDGIDTRAFAEVRVDLSEDRKIRGLAIVFGKPSVDLGGFQEIIAPEAINRTFREAIDVRAFVDHDSGKIMGRLSAGTLAMKKTAKGLQIEIDPPDTTYSRDILESMNRGDVTGMSFGFRAMEDSWDESGTVPIRTVLDMRVSEISIVSLPAYPDTSVALRSLQAFTAQRRTSPTKEQAWRRLQLAR